MDSDDCRQVDGLAAARDALDETPKVVGERKSPVVAEGPRVLLSGLDVSFEDDLRAGRHLQTTVTHFTTSIRRRARIQPAGTRPDLGIGGRRVCQRGLTEGDGDLELTAERPRRDGAERRSAAASVRSCAVEYLYAYFRHWDARFGSRVINSGNVMYAPSSGQHFRMGSVERPVPRHPGTPRLTVFGIGRVPIEHRQHLHAASTLAYLLRHQLVDLLKLVERARQVHMRSIEPKTPSPLDVSLWAEQQSWTATRGLAGAGPGR